MEGQRVLDYLNSQVISRPVNNDRAILSYYKLASDLLVQAEAYELDGDAERAYVMYKKYCDFYLNTIGKHKDYSSKKYSNERSKYRTKVKEALDILEPLKEKILSNYAPKPSKLSNLSASTATTLSTSSVPSALTHSASIPTPKLSTHPSSTTLSTTATTTTTSDFPTFTPSNSSYTDSNSSVPIPILPPPTSYNPYMNVSNPFGISSQVEYGKIGMGGENNNGVEGRPSSEEHYPIEGGGSGSQGGDGVGLFYSMEGGLEGSGGGGGIVPTAPPPSAPLSSDMYLESNINTNSDSSTSSYFESKLNSLPSPSEAFPVYGMSGSTITSDHGLSNHAIIASGYGQPSSSFLYSSSAPSSSSSSTPFSSSSAPFSSSSAPFSTSSSTLISSSTPSSTLSGSTSSSRPTTSVPASWNNLRIAPSTTSTTTTTPKDSFPVFEAKKSASTAQIPIPQQLVALRRVHVPGTLITRFLKLAEPNTVLDIETCGILCGKLEKNQLIITTVIIPEQKATSNTCVTQDEEKLITTQEKLKVITLGWIHTHPTQTCFLSAIDLHTHYSYQVMMPEAIAIVLAPSKSPNYGFFSITQPGMAELTGCTRGGFHQHSREGQGGLFDLATHVNIRPEKGKESLKVEFVDLRASMKKKGLFG